jgi:hypothetical protein
MGSGKAFSQFLIPVNPHMEIARALNKVGKTGPLSAQNPSCVRTSIPKRDGFFKRVLGYEVHGRVWRIITGISQS